MHITVKGAKTMQYNLKTDDRNHRVVLMCTSDAATGIVCTMISLQDEWSLKAKQEANKQKNYAQLIFYSIIIWLKLSTIPYTFGKLKKTMRTTSLRKPVLGSYYV